VQAMTGIPTTMTAEFRHTVPNTMTSDIPITSHHDFSHANHHDFILVRVWEYLICNVPLVQEALSGDSGACIRTECVHVDNFGIGAMY